jgi:hypothetical protein
MDQERADYDDQPARRRRPWTSAQLAIATTIIFLSLPLAFLALIVVGFVFFGADQ